jgi:hypothetical protein
MKREEIERNANLIAEAYALSFEVWQHNIGWQEMRKAKKLAEALGLEDEIEKIKETDAIQDRLMEEESEDNLDLFHHAGSIKQIHEYIENAQKRKAEVEENKKEFEKILETIKAKI